MSNLSITDEEIKGTNLGISCCRLDRHYVGQVATLVLTTRETNSTLHTRWLAMVNVETIREQRDESKRGENLLFGEILEADHLWTVD